MRKPREHLVEDQLVHQLPPQLLPPHQLTRERAMLAHGDPLQAQPRTLAAHKRVVSTEVEPNLNLEIVMLAANHKLNQHLRKMVTHGELLKNEKHSIIIQLLSDEKGTINQFNNVN